MRRGSAVRVGLPRRLTILLYIAGGLLLVAYVVHTEMYRVYIANYHSDAQIRSLRAQLERERARAAELEWEKGRLEGPDGPTLAALREGWGRPGQVLLNAKVLPAAKRREEGLYRQLTDRLRDWLRGEKRPAPLPSAE